MSSPLNPHNAHCVVSIDDNVYLFGSKNESLYAAGVECFDVNNNEWKEVGSTPSPMQASYFGTAKRVPSQLTLFDRKHLIHLKILSENSICKL